MTAKPNISTHARHLLNILSLQPEKKTEHTTNYEFKNINWAEVVEIAKKFQVFPFLNSLVVEKELISSKEIKLYFEKSRASGQLMTLRMIFEFNILNHILRDLKIDVINFKGICLSEIAYNSLYSRHFSDIDILVEFSSTIGLIQFVNIQLELEDILCKKVDLVEISTLKPQLKANILKDQIAIFS